MWPDANIGIATGKGLYPVDVDTYKGATLSDLGDIPETLTIKTGGGGLQFYFAIDQELGNTANKLGQWIDTRGEGGYVVAPGSNHISGDTYEWINDVPIAPLPAHLLEKLQPKVEPRSPRGPIHASFGDTPYGMKALNDECNDLAHTPNGGRNHQLNRAAYLMGQLVAGGELTQSTVESELTDAALRSGLSERETEKTLRSGLDAGMREPRSALEHTVPYNPPVETGKQPTTLAEAMERIAQLEQEKADLEQQNRLKDEVIHGAKAHVFSKWEKKLPALLA
jgi:hypothetical protein